MNSAAHSHLNDLHKKYLACVDTQLKEFLKNPPKEGKFGYAKEWCSAEKGEYFGFMSTNFKTEYENILRLEGNTFWLLNEVS